MWHGLLGFDLALGDTPGTLAGWTVAVDEPELCVLEVGGSLMEGCIVFEVGGGRVTWTTLLRFHGSGRRRTWSVLHHVHRVLTVRLLAGQRRRARPGDGRGRVGPRPG